MANIAACPDVPALQRLVSGKLLPAEQEPILLHLECCPSCVQRTQALSGADTLVDVVRNLDTVSLEDEKPAVARIIERLLAPAQKTERTQLDDSLSGHDDAEQNYAFLAPAQAPDEIGRLGGYRVLKVLGAGGMGIVFQAEDPQLGRLVALKVIRPEQAAKPQARQRFLREARAAAALDHDHIVHIYQVGEDRGIPFLATQMLEGMSLEQRLAKSAKLSTAQVLRIGKEVAQGLAAAHARGLIHRDIKPANLWLESSHSGRIKILDFGLARSAVAAAEPLTQAGAIMGTPAYMAPEQARGLPIDHRADLFSLGCVLYELTTGTRPFQGPDPFAVLTSLALDTPPTPRTVSLDVPADLSDLIVRLMDKSPAGRPSSAQEVVMTLADLESTCTAATPQRAAGFTPAVSPPTTSPHVSRGRRRLPILAAVGLVAAGLGIAILFGGQIIRFATNQGELVIEVADPAVEVKIVQDGVVVHDKTNKREFTLTAVKGEIEVLEKDGVKLATKRFELTRGGKTTVRVTLQELADAGKAKDPDRRAALWLVSVGGRVGIKVDGKDRAIKTAGDLPRGAFELTVVDLQDNAKVSDAGLAHFKDCKNVTQLLLNSAKVTDAGLANFKNCQRLWNLELYKTQVSDAGLAIFKDCRTLTYLRLSDMEVSDAGLAHFKDCKKLTDLDLRATQVSDAGLAQIKDCKLLTTLELGGTKVTEAGVKKLAAALPGCKIEWAGGVIVPKRTTDPDRKAAEWVLSIGGRIKIKEKGREREINAVGDLPREAFELTLVFLGDNPSLNNAALARLKDCQNLSWLDLSETQVSDAGLAALKDCKNLTALVLDRTPVTDAGLVHLKECKNLTQLHLIKSKVTAAGVALLKKALPQCEIEWVSPDRKAAEWVISIGGRVMVRMEDGIHIDWVSKGEKNDLPSGDWYLAYIELGGKQLGNQKVTDGRLSHFKRLTHLEYLELQNTRISDLGLKELHGLTRLGSVDLTGTKVTAVGVAALQNALPKCTIHWDGENDRKAAQWVLSIGGTITATGNSGTGARADLLQGAFQLTAVNLNENPKVSDAGLAHLKECKNLKDLGLSETKVMDAGIKHLAGLSKLKRLDLRGTKATAAGVAGLRKTLPRCKIEWDGKKGK